MTKFRCALPYYAHFGIDVKVLICPTLFYLPWFDNKAQIPYYTHFGFDVKVLICPTLFYLPWFGCQSLDVPYLILLILVLMSMSNFLFLLAKEEIWKPEKQGWKVPPP
jgi:hypothetical protein